MGPFIIYLNTIKKLKDFNVFMNVIVSWHNIKIASSERISEDAIVVKITKPFMPLEHPPKLLQGFFAEVSWPFPS